jgi:hypothetical protein
MGYSLIGIFVKIEDLDALAYVKVVNGLNFVLAVDFTVALLVNLNKTTDNNSFIFLAPILKLVAVIVDMNLGSILRRRLYDVNV